MGGETGMVLIIKQLAPFHNKFACHYKLSLAIVLAIQQLAPFQNNLV